ncbi:hypothetical protein ACIBQ1_37660 [Nonomuraea sp. NPDC050153]|uniref:hypothetical protein n=1 Tax=Nonomuraea sp. NPDC050153 TaxID=3364359 RepID=UPI00378ED7DC
MFGWLQGGAGVVRTIAVVTVATSALSVGGVATADVAREACTYSPTRLPGMPGSGNDIAHVTSTDGSGHFAGMGYWGPPEELSSHIGMVWKDGQVVGNFGPLSTVSDVNRAGTAVGGTESLEPLLLHNGKLSQMGRPPGNTRYFAQASAINDAGLIVGGAKFDDGTEHAVAWSADDPRNPWDLGVTGRPWALKDISDSGELAGTVQAGARTRAVTGTVETGLRPLGGVDPAADSSATDIAGSFILGKGTIPGRGAGWVLWRDGVPSPLSTTATLQDVNGSGVVVGYESTNGVPTSAVVLNGTTRTVLPPLPGHRYADAFAITEDGSVAGRSHDGQYYQSTATVWTCR